MRMKMRKAYHAVHSYRFVLAGALTIASFGLTGCASTQAAKKPATTAAVEPVKPREEIVQSFEKQRDEAQYRAALARWKEHDAYGCRQMLERVLARNPQHREALLLMAEFNLAAQHPDKSLPAIESFAVSHKDDAQVQHTLGMLLEATDRPDDAQKHFRRAAELEPQNPLFELSMQTNQSRPRAGGNREMLTEDGDYLAETAQPAI